MKKLTALLLCLCMALSLAACGKSKTQAQDPSDASAQGDVSSEYNIPQGFELKAAFPENNAPYSYVDKSGEVMGIDVDIAKAICEANQWTLSAQAIDWSKKDELLSSGAVDCAWGSVSYSESNQSEALWSIYGGVYVDATVLEDSAFSKLSDLKGKTIEVEPTAKFVLEGESATELGKQLAADAGKLVDVADASTAYKDLAGGKCDAILVSGSADNDVDFDSFGDDVIFKALYDVDIYSSEGDSSEADFVSLNSNGVCDQELGVCFQSDTDVYFAVSQTLESLLSGGKVQEIMEDWSQRDKGVYADAVARCNLYQMQEYEPDLDAVDESSLLWDEALDEELKELEDGSEEAEEAVEESDLDITADVEGDASTIAVK